MKALWLLVVVILTSGQASAAGLPADVRSVLADEPQVRLVVLLNVAEDELRGPVAGREQAIAEAGEEVLADLGEALTVHHRFIRVEALAVTVNAAGAHALAAHPRVRAISTDPGGFGHLDVSLPLVRVLPMHDFSQPPGGLRGQGMKVAVIDTGLESGNADFADQLVDEACFCLAGGSGCCPNGGTTQFGEGAAADDHGHGTWVTGSMMSRGANAPIGPAPEATVVSVKVLDSNNSFCCASDVTAAFDWLAVNHADLAIVNASLGTGALFAGVCDASTVWLQAMWSAVQAVNDNGALVVASTGNQASATGIAAPTCLSNVLAVGATWKQDFEGSFSPFGCNHVDPREDEVACFSNASAQVDVLAPGTLIATSGLGETTVAVYGTSFSSPITAGCATLLRQLQPGWSVAELRAALTTSGIVVEDTRNGLMFPRLDCLATINRIFADRLQGQ